MKMQIKRHLITTSDERTWKLDSPVLFLGEWCRLYDRKQVWSGMDAALVEPYGLEPKRKERDLAYVQALTGELLGEVANELNAFHNTRHSVRYWNIVLGHWLERYVAITFNRYFTLEHILKNYEISGTTVFDSSDYSLATNDSQAFIWACNDDVWNHVLYAKILNFLGYERIEKDSVHLQGISGFVQEENTKAAPGLNFKPLILNAANYILHKFSRKSDAFIISSYLPLIEEVKLQLSLGQCPQAWRSPVLKTVAPDQESRRRFSLDGGTYAGYEQFVRNQLGECIPTCFLEGYTKMVRQSESLPWPADPKFIFTSNNYDTDEIFKVWSGSKAEKGVPYIVGQHGNYQAVRGSSNWPERMTCDKFIAWGGLNENSWDVPAFVFKIANQPRETKPDGGLLLIELCMPHRLTLGDAYYEFGIYQEQQFRFVEALPEKIQNELTVRLHGAWRNFRWSEDRRWSDRMPSVHLETGKANIQTLIAKSRLVVHSYDSTGILEGLASNVPTLGFWDGGLDHLLPRDKPYYELLRGAGILADSPEQAALFVTQHWDDIDGWWKSEQVQSARRVFCEQYARNEKNPIRTMKQLLAQLY